MGNMAAFRRHHFCESPCVLKSARGCSTFRIDSSSGDAARRAHIRNIVFSSRRRHSSCREYVFPAGVWACRGNFLRPMRYLALIALAAFIGDLAHIALDPRSQTPCIGASGGIAGVIMFYALNFPRVRLAFLMRWGYVWFRWTRFPAWFVFVLWILFQVIGTLEQKAGMSAVSSAAHLGGAAVGLLAWLLWRKPNEESRLLE